MNPPILETRDLSLSIGGKLICKNLNLQIQAGERWGTLGVNGVGKTTLLLALAGMKAPHSGSVFLQGRPLSELTRRNAAQTCGVMFQDSDDAFPASVLETALIGRHPHLRAWEWESAADEAIARAALQAVGLAGLELRATNTLSGGERRRLALATLLTQDPALMLLDEPVNHLDLHHQIDALELLTRQVTQHGKTLLMVLHDVNLAARYCDAVLLLFGDGEVLQGATREVLTLENLTRLYGHPVRSVETAEGILFYPGTI
jgi:iron complex transport system ATP-binding protein